LYIIKGSSSALPLWRLPAPMPENGWAGGMDIEIEISPEGLITPVAAEEAAGYSPSTGGTLALKIHKNWQAVVDFRLYPWLQRLTQRQTPPRTPPRVFGLHRSPHLRSYQLALCLEGAGDGEGGKIGPHLSI